MGYMGVGYHPIKHNTRGNCDTNMPQFSFFSRNKKVLPTRQDPRTIVEEKPVSTLFRRIHQKVDVPSTAFSLPVQHGHGFKHKNLYQEPEEEVFSISLESPGRRLSQSYDWVDQGYPSSNLFTSSYSELKVMPAPDVATSALELESCHASACQLQVTPINKNEDELFNQEAPPRHRKAGRSRELTRYFHQYECEDFMEYAVDIFDWKKSLEADYLPGKWEERQSEVTSSMRMLLLEWMVDISRELEFSLETWCLAVNLLDRFLGVQPLSKDCLQLVGLTVLWIGAKQDEMSPPSTDELVSLCADSYSTTNFKHMELIVLARLNFNLAAPTPAFFLSHLVAVEDEKDWSEDLSRHLVEFIMEDHILARVSPCRIAQSVFKVIKACNTTSLRVMEGSCPKCEPQNTDQWCIEFFEACLQRVVDMLAM